MVKDEVGSDDIADVISSWTGIPAGRLLEGETEKLLHMEQHLGARLIGQVDAVRAVSDAVRRARSGVADPDRPTGSFLFLGPTGVGKTELAKSLADFLFDDERAMVRIDMSEYSERHAVARLIGAPPGYVGYEEGGQLTEAVRRRPYSVILLDEVEKAHPETFDILLQVLDDGRLTDGQGRTVDFRNVILVMTSNLGSQYLVDPLLTPESRKEAVLGIVRQTFKPEFLNRLDEVVIFDPLSTEDLTQIVDLQVHALANRLHDRRITLDVTDAAKEWLAAHRLRPDLRRPTAAAVGAEGDRRPAGQGAAVRRGSRRRHGEGRPRRRGGHARPALTADPFGRMRLSRRPSGRPATATGRARGAPDPGPPSGGNPSRPSSQVSRSWSVEWCTCSATAACRILPWRTTAATVSGQPGVLGQEPFEGGDVRGLLWPAPAGRARRATPSPPRSS